MGANLLSYVVRLELMAFFAGYPLLYTVLHLWKGEMHGKKAGVFPGRLADLLPYGYALSGLLFLGLVLKNLYPDYSFHHISLQFQANYLRVWGLLSLLFWIPALPSKGTFSLLHSVVFFALLLWDILLQINGVLGKELLANDMKIYTISLLLQVVTFLCIALGYFLFLTFKTKR